MSQYRDSMNRADSTMDDARNRLNEGMDGARSAAHNAKDYVSSKFQDARDSMGHMSDEMRDTFQSLRDTDYDEMWDGVQNKVRENPGPALLLAGAVGLAIGVLLVGSGAAASRRR